MLSEYRDPGLGVETAKATLEYARDTLKLDNIITEAVVEISLQLKFLKKLSSS